MDILWSDDFTDWYEGETAKVRSQIESRLLKIELDGHFGNHKKLSKHLYELKFNNGNRIYYTIKDDMFLILGGNKNGQSKDIKKADKAANKIHEET